VLLPRLVSTRHSGALQMTNAPAYNWYVSNQYLDTRDTGCRDSRNVCFWLAPPPPPPPPPTSPPPWPPPAARTGWSRSFLVHCNAAAALITIRASYVSRSRTHAHPLSGRPLAQLCLPMRLPLTRWHSEQTPLVGESCSYEHSGSCKFDYTLHDNNVIQMYKWYADIIFKNVLYVFFNKKIMKKVINFLCDIWK